MTTRLSTAKISTAQKILGYKKNNKSLGQQTLHFSDFSQNPFAIKFSMVLF